VRESRGAGRRDHRNRISAPVMHHQLLKPNSPCGIRDVSATSSCLRSSPLALTRHAAASTRVEGVTHEGGGRRTARQYRISSSGVWEKSRPYDWTSTPSRRHSSPAGRVRVSWDRRQWGGCLESRVESMIKRRSVSAGLFSPRAAKSTYYMTACMLPPRTRCFRDPPRLNIFRHRGATVRWLRIPDVSSKQHLRSQILPKTGGISAASWVAAAVAVRASRPSIRIHVLRGRQGWLDPRGWSNPPTCFGAARQFPM